MNHHPSDEDLSRLAAAGLPAEEAGQIVGHVIVCNACSEKLDGLFRGPEATTDDYEVGDALLAQLRQRRERSLAGEQSARETVALLIAQPTQRRQTWARNSRRLQTPEIARGLILAARELLFDDPEESLSLSLLALELADALDSGTGGATRADLQSLAWSDIGNCRRILGDLQGARQAVNESARAIEDGSHDPLVEARFLEVSCALHWAAQDLAAAFRTNARVLRMFRDLGQEHDQGRALVMRAVIEWAERPDERAVETINQALALLKPRLEPRVYLAALQNLARFLVGLGRTSEAQGLMQRVKRLPEADDRAFRHRIEWSEAQLSRQAGDPERAAVVLEGVVDGLLDIGQVIPAAQALLELATLRFEAHRFAEVRELAARTLPIFKSQGIHREALAAYTLFVQAAEAETLTRSLLAELSQYFGQFRPREARPFRPGGEGAASPS